MDFYIMQDNYRNRYLIVIGGDMYVYNHDTYKFDPPFFFFKPKHVFFGKSKDCEMTEFSQAEDKDGFDANTFLLECENSENVYIAGLEISKLKTDDKIICCISLMGNNMIPYTIILGKKFTYFLNNRFKFIENDKIEDGV